MNVGFIDYYLDEWHANHYPQLLQQKSDGRLKVAYAYGKIDSPITGKTSKQWCKEFGVQHCETIEEVVEKSDVLIVLSPDNCEMHEELCKKPLMSGKRTYVDKTFAPDQKTAKAIFEVAEAHNTPCYSTSALRFASEYEELKRQNIQAAAFWGPYDLETYSIHQLEPMSMLMQGNVKRVLAQQSGGWTQICLEWSDGRAASLTCTGKDGAFWANVGLEQENRIFQITSDNFGAFIENLVSFLEGEDIPVTHSETVRIMAVREACLKASRQPGIWFEV
jgi:hypothetical protein